MRERGTKTDGSTEALGPQLLIVYERAIRVLPEMGNFRKEMENVKKDKRFPDKIMNDKIENVEDNDSAVSFE